MAELRRAPGYRVSWVCGHEEIVQIIGKPLDAREREALILHVASHRCPDCRRWQLPPRAQDR